MLFSAVIAMYFLFFTKYILEYPFCVSSYVLGAFIYMSFCGTLYIFESCLNGVTKLLNIKEILKGESNE